MKSNKRRSLPGTRSAVNVFVDHPADWIRAANLVRCGPGDFLFCRIESGSSLPPSRKASEPKRIHFTCATNAGPPEASCFGDRSVDQGWQLGVSKRRSPRSRKAVPGVIANSQRVAAAQS